MLAGDVTVKVTGSGSVVLMGDNAGNQVMVGTNSDGDLLVTGLSGTNIHLNGTTEISQTISLATRGQLGRDLIVRLRGGDDELIVENLYVGGIVNVNLSSGSDRMAASFLEANDFKLVGGAGTDEIDLSFLDIQNEAMINLGSVAEGADRLDATLSTFGSVTVRGGRGDTDVYFVSSTIEGSTSVSTGGGDDHVEFLDASAEGVRVSTSGGNDVVVVGLSDFNQRLDVILGGGDDSASFTGPASANSAVLNGGSGDDALEFLSLLSAVGTISNLSFETVV